MTNEATLSKCVLLLLAVLTLGLISMGTRTRCPCDAGLKEGDFRCWSAFGAIVSTKGFKRMKAAPDVSSRFGLTLARFRSKQHHSMRCNATFRTLFSSHLVVLCVLARKAVRARSRSRASGPQPDDRASCADHTLHSGYVLHPTCLAILLGP